LTGASYLVTRYLGMILFDIMLEEHTRYRQELRGVRANANATKGGSAMEQIAESVRLQIAVNIKYRDKKFALT